jgi:hypothetical protein
MKPRLSQIQESLRIVVMVTMGNMVGKSSVQHDL